MSNALPAEAWRALIEHRMASVEDALVKVSNSLETLTKLQLEAEHRNQVITEMKAELAGVKRELADIKAEMPGLKATKRGAAKMVEVIGVALLGALLAAIGLKLKP